MNKKFILLNLIILGIFFYYLKNNIKINYIILIFKEIELKDIFLIFLLFLIRPVLITIRWFILVKNFTNLNFLDFFKNIIMGSSLNFITSTSIALDVVKFTKIQKDLGLNKSIFLVILDKIYTLIFKILFLLIILNLFNLIILKTNIIGFFLLSVLILLVSYFFKEKLIIFLNKLGKRKFNLNISDLHSILILSNKKFLNIFFINFIIQILNIYLYFIIFTIYGGELNFFEISIFTTVIDFIAQMQFMVIGLKEFATVYLSNFITLSNEIALAGALTHRLFDTISVVCLFLIFNFLIYNSNKS